MSEETLSRIAGWCEAEEDLSTDGSTITVAGQPPLRLSIEIGDDALMLAHTHTVPEVPHGFAEAAVEMLGRRGSMVTGDVVTGADSTDVHIRYPIYLDGLNRQSFLVGVREITGTVDGLERLTTSARQPAGRPSPTSSAGPTPPPSQPEPRPAASASPAPWAPTHQVPPTGMAAWSQPDPSAAPVASLSPRVQLRVDEQRGAWASVTGSNGWTGWVDARILQPIGTAAPAASASWSAPSTPAAGSQAAGRAGSIGGMPVPALVGGVMVLVSAFLAWGDWTYAKGMDVPFGALWPISEWVNWMDPRIGLVLVVAGVVAILAAAVPGFPAALRTVAGLVAILVAAGIILQAITSGFGSDLLDLRFTGLGVALVGGILVVLPGSRTR